MKKNLHIILPFIVAGLLLLYAYGCEPRTGSLITPGEKVNRKQLLTEFEMLEYKLESSIENLDQQQRIRDLIFQQGLIIAQSGGVNPIGLITALMSVLGVGAIADDVRLRKKIKADTN